MARALHPTGPGVPSHPQSSSPPQSGSAPSPPGPVASGHSPSGGFGAIKSVPTEFRPRILSGLQGGPSIRTPRLWSLGAQGNRAHTTPVRSEAFARLRPCSWVSEFPETKALPDTELAREPRRPSQSRQEELWVVFIPRSRSCSSTRSERPTFARCLLAMRLTTIQVGRQGLLLTPDPTSGLYT